MGSISLGTMSLGEQQKLNALVKKELVLISDLIIIGRGGINILANNSLSFSVLLKLSRLVTSNINILYTNDGVTDPIITTNLTTDTNEFRMLSDWSDTDLINFTFHY